MVESPGERRQIRRTKKDNPNRVDRHSINKCVCVYVCNKTRFHAPQRNNRRRRHVCVVVIARSAPSLIKYRFL